jgi:hypothetical protein
MWCAMGQCYEHEQLGLNDAAIRCYRRALANGEREGIALHKLVCAAGHKRISPFPDCVLRHSNGHLLARHAEQRCMFVCTTAACSLLCRRDDAACNTNADHPAGLQAHLHARRGEREQAAHYYKLNLEAIDTMNLSGTDALAALDFLAEHSFVRVAPTLHCLTASPLVVHQAAVRKPVGHV